MTTVMQKLNLSEVTARITPTRKGEVGTQKREVYNKLITLLGGAQHGKLVQLENGDSYEVCDGGLLGDEQLSRNLFPTGESPVATSIKFTVEPSKCTLNILYNTPEATENANGQIVSETYRFDKKTNTLFITQEMQSWRTTTVRHQMGGKSRDYLESKPAMVGVSITDPFAGPATIKYYIGTTNSIDIVDAESLKS